MPLDKCWGQRQQRQEFIANALHPAPANNVAFEQHLIDTYGGCWRFNEVIGYIRLYFLGGQVRGEYFAVRRKRMVRTRTKRFDWVTHKLAPEVEIRRPVSEQSIEAAVHKYLCNCRRELPRRFVDTSVFDVLAKHIRWYDLWATANSFGPERKEMPKATTLPFPDGNREVD